MKERNISVLEDVQAILARHGHGEIVLRQNEYTIVFTIPHKGGNKVVEELNKHFTVRLGRAGNGLMKIIVHVPISR